MARFAQSSNSIPKVRKAELATRRFICHLNSANGFGWDFEVHDTTGNDGAGSRGTKWGEVVKAAHPEQNIIRHQQMSQRKLLQYVLG
jgi:hypothetical protein